VSFYVSMMYWYILPMAVYHYHLLINGFCKRPPKGIATTEQWLRNLIEKIDMKIAIPPRAAYVEKEGNRGMTAVAGIETSHIAMHVWDETNPAFVQFDLYTCSTLNVGLVIKELESFLLLENYEKWLLDRSEGFRHIDDMWALDK
jgi:S-adenosylmethionine/arginine decarboxylase-like enzyme